MANAETAQLKTTAGLLPRSSRAADDHAPRAFMGERWLHVFQMATESICDAIVNSAEPYPAIAKTIDDAAKALRCRRSKMAETLVAHAMGDPRLSSLSPVFAAQAHLILVAAAAGAGDAFLWVRRETGKLMRVAALREEADWDNAEVLARLVGESPHPFAVWNSAEGTAVRICRRDACQGVFVLTAVGETEPGTTEALTAAAAKQLSMVLERWHLLDWSQAREQALLKSSEKKMVRLGYDLHDGPLQEIAALANEIKFLRADIEPLVLQEARGAVSEGFENLIEQVAGLEQTMRGIAQSLETATLRRESLDVLVRRETAEFERRTGVTIETSLDGDLTGLTESQRIALYRVVQEALTNVREHSHASRVSVKLTSDKDGVALTISDDGRGFEMATELDAAARRGRLGLIGIAERIRLLGGVLRLSSEPGRGTTLTVTLAPWLPPASFAEQDTTAPPYFS